MKKKITLLASALLVICFLTSCSVGKTQVVWTGGFASDQIFKMEDESCVLGEANVLMANYKNQYLASYGDELWKRAETSTEYTLEAYLKDVTLSQMAKMTCMNLLAKKEKLSLTKEEKDKVLLISKEYFDSLTKDEINELATSKESVTRLVEKYALATKLYTELTVGVNEEVSDDDARIMQVMQIVVSKKENANKITQRLNESGDFAATANLYNEEQVIELFVSRKDVPLQIEKIIFDMDDNQISSCIAQDNKFYFYKIMNKFDKEKTDDNKLVIIDERAKQAFDDVYEDFSKKIKTEYNSSMWELVKADFSDKVKTDSFFQVFEKHLGELRKSR